MRKNLDMEKSPAIKIANLIRNDASIDCVEVTAEVVTFYTSRQDVMDILFPKPQRTDGRTCIWGTFYPPPGYEWEY